MDFRFSQTFSLLQQEGHLTKHTLLTGFDLLLKANFTDTHIGHYYSAFFQISIGIERLLKLTAITDYMLENNFSPPTDKELKSQYGHKIKTLYSHCIDICNKRSEGTHTLPEENSNEAAVLDFLDNYANQARYYNLSQLSNKTLATSPLA